MLDFFGRFHPVLVHLPIGFLILAVLFQWMGRSNAFSFLRLSVPVILVLGMISAFFACITGLALSGTAEYEEDILGWHQWMGIITTLLSLGMFWAVQRKKVTATNGFSVMLLVGITITGHFGGTLTHGENYLSFAKPPAKPTLLPITDIQSMHAYNDLVQPIFEARCISCHGSGKQKGKLRLDEPSFILKGGEDGLAVKAGDLENSELIKRILLPENVKKHMPPVAEAQLTDPEIQFLQWWVKAGASFEQKVSELPQTATDKEQLLTLQAASQGASVDSAGNKKAISKAVSVQPVFTLTASIPEQKVAPADPAVVQRLKKSGVMVIPVSQESNYLSVNFVTAGTIVEDSTLLLLEQLRAQLIWLKIDEMEISASGFSIIGRLSGLTRLQLSHTNLSDQAFTSVTNLKELQWLNLVGAPVSAARLVQLGTLPKLKQLFVYKASITAADWTNLSKALPGVQIDTGNYRLPLLPGDTSLVK